MADEIIHQVKLSLTRDFAFDVQFDDLPSVHLTLDEPPPLGQRQGPNAAALLAAAVGNCLAASLRLCLQKSRAHVEGMSAIATVHLTRNDVGRYRVHHIDVQLLPVIVEEDGARLERCADLFEDFCIVTESVRNGIPVNVTVTEQVAAPA